MYYEILKRIDYDQIVAVFKKMYIFFSDQNRRKPQFVSYFGKTIKKEKNCLFYGSKKNKGIMLYERKF